MGTWAWIERGDVSSIIVADKPTIDLFIAYSFFPGVTFYDVTSMSPKPQIGWTYQASGRDPAFRSPAPGEGWWWDDIHGEWAPPVPSGPTEGLRS